MDRRSGAASTAAVVGSAYTALGVVVLARAELERFDHGRRHLDAAAGGAARDVVRVLGTTHTARLGAIELSVGVVLVLAAITRSRFVILATGVALGVGGVVLLDRHEAVRAELAAGRGHAVVVLTSSVVVCLGAIVGSLGPRRTGPSVVGRSRATRRGRSGPRPRGPERVDAVGGTP